ncbi:MAG: nuclear transport factor 2 family protein [Steroidobacteraceae bacterium]|mgnify:CR=1 FL=1
MTMSSTEVVRKLFETAVAGDFEALKQYLHPDVRVNEAESLPYGGVYVGIDQMVALNAHVFSFWTDFSITVKQLFGEGEWVTALTEMQGKARTTGLAFKMPLSEVFRVKDGKIVEITPYYFDTKLLCDAMQGTGGKT